MNQKCITKCGRVVFTLNGGIRVGEVTEIYRESGVGKTQICMHLLLTCLLDPDDGELYGFSIYIQACPVFPSNKLKQLSSHFVENKVVDANPLSLVHVKKVDHPGQLFLVFNKVELMVLNSHEGCRHTRVVLLDSIAKLLRHDHDYSSKGFIDRKRSIRAAAEKMKEIANNYSIDFIVVNQVTDVFETYNKSMNKYNTALPTYTSGREVKASLGTFWENLMPNKMFISKQYVRASQTWYREWMVVNSTKAQLQGRRCAFRITNSGLVD